MTKDGYVVDLGDEGRFFVCGGVGVIHADMPECNDIAGAAAHNSKLHPCHACHVPKSALNSFDGLQKTKTFAVF